jgi:hypothetical protein
VHKSPLVPPFAHSLPFVSHPDLPGHPPSISLIALQHSTNSFQQHITRSRWPTMSSITMLNYTKPSYSLCPT